MGGPARASLIDAMEHFFTVLLNVVTTSLLSPLGLLVTFTVAFTGELGVSPPAVLQAAFVAAGVQIANGSFGGLALFPVVIAAAVLGTTTSLTLTRHGVRFLSRFTAPPKWAQGSGFLQRLPKWSPFTVALVRQLPGSQLPLTLLWEATKGSWSRFLVGVSLSVVIHGGVMMLMGITSGSLMASSGHAFAIAFALSMVASVSLFGVAHLVRRSSLVKFNRGAP